MASGSSPTGVLCELSKLLSEKAVQPLYNFYVRSPGVEVFG